MSATVIEQLRVTVQECEDKMTALSNILEHGFGSVVAQRALNESIGKKMLIAKEILEIADGLQA